MAEMCVCMCVGGCWLVSLSVDWEVRRSSPGSIPLVGFFLWNFSTVVCWLVSLSVDWEVRRSSPGSIPLVGFFYGFFLWPDLHPGS